MSTQFKFVFFVRFLGYFLFFIGLTTILVVLTPVIGAELFFRKDKLFNVERTVPKAKVGFGELGLRENIITPVSTDFGVVIEKINANSLILPNIDPLNETEYTQALGKGVAHAKGSDFPGSGGNIYLFSHSTDAPWNLVRFNAVFYLLRELNTGDRVILFYNGRRFDYKVFDKIVVEPEDTGYLTNKYDEEVLTLQTCDPPGTRLKRLIVRAKLEGT